MANADAFGHVRPTADCYSAIHVDTHNLQRVGIRAQGEFATFGVANKDAFSDTIITSDPCAVTESSSFVNNKLSVLTNCFHVRNKRDIE